MGNKFFFAVVAAALAVFYISTRDHSPKLPPPERDANGVILEQIDEVYTPKNAATAIYFMKDYQLWGGKKLTYLPGGDFGKFEKEAIKQELDILPDSVLQRSGLRFIKPFILEEATDPRAGTVSGSGDTIQVYFKDDASQRGFGVDRALGTKVRNQIYAMAGMTPPAALAAPAAALSVQVVDTAPQSPNAYTDPTYDAKTPHSVSVTLP